MVLFELLTQQPPYEGESAPAIAVAIATCPPPDARALRPEVPEGLSQAIQRALGKRPDERFADLAAFAETIAPFGGPGARSSAASVRRVLSDAGIAPAPAPAPAPHQVGGLGALSEDAITAPLLETAPGLTSSFRAHGRLLSSPRRARWIGLGAAGALAGALMLWTALPAPSAQPAAAGLGPVLVAAAAAVPRPTANAPAATATEAAPQASAAPEAPPSRTQPRSTGKPIQRQTPRPTKQPEERDPAEVFGARGPKRN
jgi:serine/threonine-protein kinase